MIRWNSRKLATVAGIVSVALVVAGCGGGEEVPPVDPATPTPGAVDPGAVVGGPDPLADPNAAAGAGAGATATIPDLSGGDVGSSLGKVSDDPLSPQASQTAPKTGTKELATDLGEAIKDTTDKVAATYSGAVISIDGVVHTVSKNGAFPKKGAFLRLVSVTATSVEIKLIAGELTTSGAQAFYLDKGKTVGLLNASEQVTYKVRFIRAVENTTGITGDTSTPPSPDTSPGTDSGLVTTMPEYTGIN